MLAASLRMHRLCHCEAWLNATQSAPWKSMMNSCCVHWLWAVNTKLEGGEMLWDQEKRPGVHPPHLQRTLSVKVAVDNKSTRLFYGTVCCRTYNVTVDAVPQMCKIDLVFRIREEITFCSTIAVYTDNKGSSWLYVVLKWICLYMVGLTAIIVRILQSFM